MARSTSVKISSEPYDFDRPSAVSGVLPQGAGSGKRSLATLSATPDLLEAGQQLVGALGHVLRGDGLGGLGAHLVGLRVQRGGLLLGVRPLALAALLVGLALLAGSASSPCCRRRSRRGWRRGSSTLLTTVSSRSTSWRDHDQAAACRSVRKSRSQMIESASRWLVGSSSSSGVARRANRMRASSTRRR